MKIGEVIPPLQGSNDDSVQKGYFKLSPSPVLMSMMASVRADKGTRAPDSDPIRPAVIVAVDAPDEGSSEAAIKAVAEGRINQAPVLVVSFGRYVSKLSDWFKVRNP